MPEILRGRPPVNDPDKVKEYYQRVGRPIPPGVLERAEAAMRARQSGSVRTVQRAASPVMIPPRPETNESEAEIIARVKHRFHIVQDFTHAMVDGDMVGGMVISGAGGVGKSHTVKRILTDAKERKGKQVEVIGGGKITGVNLYMAFYRNRNPGNILLFDDCDSMWDDGDMLALLKGGLDSVPERQMSWGTEAQALKDAGIEKTFMYRGAAIFISNKDFQTICDVGRGTNVEHLKAVMTRTQYVDLKLHTPRELCAWVKHLTMETHMLVTQCGLTREQEREVVEWISEQGDKLREISLRTPMKCAPYIKRYGKDWRKTAAMMLLR